MKYTPEKFELKDGRISIIREIEVKDAAETVEYLKTVMGESDFLYSYPEEITLTVDKEEKMIKGFNESEDILMLVAEMDGKLIANGQISRSKKKENASSGKCRSYCIERILELRIREEDAPMSRRPCQGMGTFST